MPAPLLRLSQLLTLILLTTTSLTAAAATPTPTQAASLPTIFNNAVYDLLIITHPIFHPDLLPLAFHKNRLGVRTIIIDTTTIYNQMYFQGRDHAEKIKYFIKAAIEHWGIKYVLLVGGLASQNKNQQWWLPVRYSHLDRPYEAYPEGKFLSDLYFADIYTQNGSFSSWDDNNNGIFGEWALNQTAADRPDLIPDVGLGRLPATNANEVRVVVRKIITYENQPKRNTSWFNTMIVAAGDTYPGRTPYYDGEVYTQQGLDLMKNFTPVKLWTSDGTFTKASDIIKKVDHGCGFLWLSGHGNPKVWGTHPPDDNNTWINLRIRDLTFLHNGKKLPVLITGSGCFNSMFNVSFRNRPWVFSLPTLACFSWIWVIKPNGGSIATIGATAFSYESPDISLGVGGIEWLDRQFFAEYGVNHTTILGDTWRAAVTHVAQECPINWDDTSVNGAAIIAKNLEQWILFGDPSLQIGGYA